MKTHPQVPPFHVNPLARLSRRTFLQSSLALGFAGAVPGFLSAAENRKRFELRTATLVPDGTSIDQILRTMGDKWKNAPEGGVTYTPYTGAAMGTEGDVIRRMRVGQLQAGVLMSTGLALIDPAMTCLQTMPFIFRSLDEVDYVCDRLLPALREKLRAKGFELLFLTDAGWIRYFSKKPAVLPEDFKRLKMFASVEDREYIELMRAIGFQPVPLAFSEILTGLSSGNMIEALASPPFYALAGQFYTAARHMLEINWVPLTGGMVVRREKWAELPKATQDFLISTAHQAAEEIRQRTRAEAEQAVETMKKRGLIVHPLGPKAQEAWDRFAESLYGKIRGKLVPTDMFDQVRDLLREYRARQTGEKK